MKRKVIFRVQMNCPKCKTKALEIVAQGEGVEFVGLQDQHKDQVVVIGDGVDSVELAKNLRKKVGHTDIISVEDAKKK